MQLDQIEQDLVQKIQAILATSANIDLEYPQPEFGDLAIPCFALAKLLKQAPHQIALQLQTALTSLDYVSSAQVVNGYVNLRIKPEFLIEQIGGELLPQLAVADRKKIALEFASPNTNKPLHLGHIRNIALGESIYRLLRSQGHTIIKTQIINDRGIAIAKMMLIYDLFHTEEIPIGKSDHYAGKLYIEFENRAEDNPNLIDQAQDVLVKWEAGDRYWIEIWLKLRNWVIQGQQETYQKLQTEFDEDVFESDIYHKGKEIVLDGLKREIFKKDPEQGYIYADLGMFGLPNKILLRSQGTALYITQDLALLQYRLSPKSVCYEVDYLVYITDFSQHLQFQQLFAIAQQLGLKPDGLYHIGYGLFRLPEGKMSSRKGTIVNADPFIQEIENRVRQIYFEGNDLPEQEKYHRIEVIARASYLFYILSTSSKKDIVFDIDSSVSLTGKTGPYILYTYARLHSILKKSSQNEYSYQVGSEFNPLEKEIILKLAKFGQARDFSVEEYDPAYMAHYVYELAELVNSYYHSSPILQEKDEKIRNNRLYLVKTVKDCLQQGLELLSINTLEEM